MARSFAPAASGDRSLGRQRRAMVAGCGCGRIDRPASRGPAAGGGAHGSSPAGSPTWASKSRSTSGAASPGAHRPPSLHTLPASGASIPSARSAAVAAENPGGTPQSPWRRAWFPGRRQTAPFPEPQGVPPGFSLTPCGSTDEQRGRAGLPFHRDQPSRHPRDAEPRRPKKRRATVDGGSRLARFKAGLFSSSWAPRFTHVGMATRPVATARTKRPT